MIRRCATVVAVVVVALTGCGPSVADPGPDPAQLADSLIADEQAIRDPATPEPALISAAQQQQAAYRDIARHPDWDAVIAPRIPAALAQTYNRNVDAARELFGMTPPKDTVPPWTIQSPAPADELLGYFHEAQQASGVDWTYLAAINLVESRFGRINGNSSAGAQGPMQFLPATFAAYGSGDIHAPRDAILAAGRYLAANGFAADPDGALHHYNHSAAYVRAVGDYAAVMAADPAAFAGYYQWQVYYRTTAGDILLPVGYSASSPTPAADYLATHPQ
ncbi:transglycosylase SLT domain-containing protein [Mycolicibacterium sp. CBMA 311]|uniref:lytic transglycosylase domain-containing protein n=1 Tax=unclassified Mycolicibacterium TaxID=2636767 RepID=UPI0035CCD4C2